MNSEMEKDILKVLVTEEELKTRIAELGEALYKRYEGHRPLFLGVLKGSFIFVADLMRASQLMCDVEFIAVSSYQNGTVSSGRVQITHDLQQDITGREIVIVEDILDSGNTLAFLKSYLMAKGAKRISPPAGKRRWKRICPALWCRTNSWWATVWIMPSFTGICLTSVC